MTPTRCPGCQLALGSYEVGGVWYCALHVPTTTKVLLRPAE